jgi:hypothetical protein
MHPSSPGIVGTGSGRSITFAPERLGTVIADAQAGPPWRAELGIRQPSTPLEHSISGMFHAAYPDAAAGGDPPRVFDAATGAGISRLGTVTLPPIRRSWRQALPISSPV